MIPVDRAGSVTGIKSCGFCAFLLPRSVETGEATTLA